MQFRPPSQPGWGQSEPEQPQQEFPQQQNPSPFFQQLQSPTQPAWQEPQYPPRPETYYPPQQPLTPPPPPLLTPPPPQKKRMRRSDKIALWIIGSVVGVFVLIVGGVIINAGASTSTSSVPNTQSTPTIASAQLTATDVSFQQTAVAVSNSWMTDTPTAQPTDTPTSQPTSIPTTPVPTFATFTDGTFQVGSDIKPGTYRTQTASSGCYYARLKGFGGTTDDILANNLTDYPAIVTILPSDKGFLSQNCGIWTADLSQITTSKTTFDNGMYFVGTDIAPGTYKNTASQSCYYARLHGFSNSTDDIIANNLTNNAAIVTIYASDKGFETHNCGTWTKL